MALRFAREGWPFVAPFWVLALALLAFRRPAWAAVAGLAGLAVLLFFRDPPRRFQGISGRFCTLPMPMPRKMGMPSDSMKMS